MAQSVSMEQLSDYLSEQIKQIQAIEKEIGEIQAGFNSAYADFKTKHDATLKDLAEKVAAQFDAVEPALRDLIGARQKVEAQAIEERRKALRETEIPRARQEADARLTTARQVEAERAQSNPLLDQKEEKQKAQLRDLSGRLDALNKEVGQLGRGLGFVTRYGRIVKLDRERNRVIGQIEATRKAVDELRTEWKSVVTTTETEESTLQGEWRDLSVKAAGLQAELDYLDDDGERAALARKRAITAVLDDVVDPAAYPAGALHDEIQQMIRLNIQTDNYQRGLGTVAGIIGLLSSVAKGFTSFVESVNAIVKEQTMHGAYLKKLSVQVPDVVLRFNAQWETLRKKVQDDARLTKYPLEFIAIVQPALDESLSKPTIEAMFNALGAELQRATKGWRG